MMGRAKRFSLLIGAAGVATQLLASAAAAAAEEVLKGDDDGAGVKTEFKTTQGANHRNQHTSSSDAGFQSGDLTKLFLLVVALSIPAGIIGFFAWQLVRSATDREQKKEVKKQLKQKHKGKLHPGTAASEQRLKKHH